MERRFAGAMVLQHVQLRGNSQEYLLVYGTCVQSGMCLGYFHAGEETMLTSDGAPTNVAFKEVSTGEEHSCGRSLAQKAHLFR